MGRDYRQSRKKPKYKRKFDGKEYTYYYGYDSKKKADNAADGFRKKSRTDMRVKARVVKGRIRIGGRSRNDYRVYYRKEKIPKSKRKR